MNFFIRITGLVAILTGVGLFCFWFTDFEASPNLFTAIFCDENETMVRRYTTDDDGTSTDFYCKDEDGRQRNVSVQVHLIMLGLAGSLIIGGYLMIKSGTGIFPRFMPPISVEQMAAGHTFFLKQIETMTLTQDTYTSEEVERKMHHLQLLLQSGLLTQEQFDEISDKFKRRRM